jgi:hypothetical protein
VCPITPAVLHCAVDRELRTWATLSTERTVLVAVVYASLLVVMAFSVYINLLYGVKFNSVQSRAWIIASFTAFVSDAVINEPVVLMARTIVRFAKKVMMTSLDAVLVARLGAKLAVQTDDDAKKLLNDDNIAFSEALTMPDE